MATITALTTDFQLTWLMGASCMELLFDDHQGGSFDAFGLLSHITTLLSELHHAQFKLWLPCL